MIEKLSNFGKVSILADLPNIDYNIFDCSVSVDGTWQKRYGFSSLLGVIYLISMETRELLNYAVKSKICFECKARNNREKTSERYKNWYIKHEKECAINHIESSGEMEKAAAVTMFLRSIEKHIWRQLSCGKRGLSGTYSKEDGN